MTPSEETMIHVTCISNVRGTSFISMLLYSRYILIYIGRCRVSWYPLVDNVITGFCGRFYNLNYTRRSLHLSIVLSSTDQNIFPHILQSCHWYHPSYKRLFCRLNCLYSNLTSTQPQIKSTLSTVWRDTYITFYTLPYLTLTTHTPAHPPHPTNPTQIETLF